MSSKNDFVVENGELKKYKGKGGSVEIPDGVTSIANCAFYGCSGVTSVTIPDGVTSIGGSAFWGAFYGCESLAIHAPSGSYAEKYAKEMRITFITE